MNDTHPMKSLGGPGRLLNALRYSAQGLRAAMRHEAAFRQELLLAALLLASLPWLARSFLHAALLVGVLVALLVVELLNSALEALADAQSVERVPLLGRAKDLGSAAVLLTLLFALALWAEALFQAVQAALLTR